jgi:hypothetical protein
VEWLLLSQEDEEDIVRQHLRCQLWEEENTGVCRFQYLLAESGVAEREDFIIVNIF